MNYVIRDIYFFCRRDLRIPTPYFLIVMGEVINVILSECIQPVGWVERLNINPNQIQ